MDTLNKKIEELKALRENLEAGKSVAAKMYENLKNDPAFFHYEDMKERNKKMDAAITQLENEIRTFEKAAKDGQIPSNIVETDTEPRAKIASKL